MSGGLGGGGGANWTYGSLTTLNSTTHTLLSGLPAGVTDIEVLVNDMSTPSTDRMGIRLGDGGGIETSGYESTDAKLTTSAVSVLSGDGTGLLEWGVAEAAASTMSIMKLSLMDAATNTWLMAAINRNTTASVSVASGLKTLSAAITQLQIYTNGGAYDAGSAIARYK
jgi:hypothetical protein